MLRKVLFTLLALILVGLIFALIIPAGRAQLARPVIAVGTPELRVWCVEQLGPQRRSSIPALRTWLTTEDFASEEAPLVKRRDALLSKIFEQEGLPLELGPELFAAAVVRLRQRAADADLDLEKLDFSSDADLLDSAPATSLQSSQIPEGLLERALSSKDPARQITAMLALIQDDPPGGKPEALTPDQSLALSSLARSPDALRSFLAQQILLGRGTPRSSLFQSLIRAQVAALERREPDVYRDRFLAPLIQVAGSWSPSERSDWKNQLRAALADPHDRESRIVAAALLAETGERGDAISRALVEGLRLESSSAAQQLAIGGCLSDVVPARLALGPLLELTTAETWRRYREHRREKYDRDLIASFSDARELAVLQAFQHYDLEARGPLALLIRRGAPHLRLIAVEASAYIPSPGLELKSAMRAAAESDDRGLRRAAASVLCLDLWQDLDWVDAALFDEDPVVAAFAADAIERCPERYAILVPDVLEALKTDRPPIAILRAVAALGPLARDAAPRLQLLESGGYGSLDLTLARLRVGDGSSELAEATTVALERHRTRDHRLALRLVRALAEAPMTRIQKRANLDLMRELERYTGDLQLLMALAEARRRIASRAPIP